MARIRAERAGLGTLQLQVAAAMTNKCTVSMQTRELHNSR